MTDDYQVDEARVLQTGASIEAGPFVFQGSLDAARRFLERLPADDRASLSVWTPGHVFTVAELLSETPGAEHIPL